MKRIEIFVEGISELIFVRDILQKLYAYDVTKIYIQCISLNPPSNPNDLWNFGNKDAEYLIEIIDTGSYTRLLSAITNRAKRFSENKVSLVLGLRDVDSKEYSEYKKIYTRDDSIKKVEEGILKGLSLTSFDMNVMIYYAEMELEAWFLALHKVFPLIDTRLTAAYIKLKLGLDIENIDPETALQKPSLDLTKILALIGKHDDKPKRTKVIANYINLDLVEEVRNIKVKRMFDFIDKLKRF